MMSCIYIDVVDYVGNCINKRPASLVGHAIGLFKVCVEMLSFLYIFCSKIRQDKIRLYLKVVDDLHHIQ